MIENDSMEVGSWVAPFRSEHLVGGRSYRNPLAIVVCLDPFRLMSECGTTYWCKDIKRDNFYVIDRKRREIPEVVLEKMKKYGLKVPENAEHVGELYEFSFRVYQDDPKLEFSIDGTFKTRAKSVGHAYDKLKNKFPNASITVVIDETEV